MGDPVKARGSVVVACPPDEAYALLADPTRIPAWRKDITSCTPPDAQGRYVETMRFFGVQTQTFEIVEREPSRRLVVRAVAGLKLRPTQAYTVTPQGDGARIDYEITLPVDGPMRLLLQWMIPRKWRGYMIALQALTGTSTTRRS